MDVTGVTELSLAGWTGRLSQDLGIRMLRQAAQQDAAVLQIVSAAAEGQLPTQSSAQNNLGSLLDITV